MKPATSRRFAMTLMLAGASLLASVQAFAQAPIKLGILEDESGNFAIAVIPKIFAYQLAVDVKIPLLGMIKRKAEKVIIDTALKELKKRVEA